MKNEPNKQVRTLSSEFKERRTNQIFGKNLKILRKKRGISQKEISQKIGIATSTYQRYEEGYLPKGDHLLRICDFFNCSADWLLYGTGQMKRAKATEDQVPTLLVKEEPEKYANTEDLLSKSIAQAAQELDIALDAEDKLIAKLLVKKGLLVLAKKALLSIQEMAGREEDNQQPWDDGKEKLG